MANSENNATGGNGRNKLMNVLDQYIPMRSLMPMLVVLGSIFVGGLKLEQFILDGFASTNATLASQEQQIQSLNEYIRSRGEQRDDQIRQINGRIDDLATKQTAENDQFNLMRLQISNIVQDLAVMKCQTSHRC